MNIKTTNPELSRLLTAELIKTGHDVNTDFRNIDNDLIGRPIDKWAYDYLQIRDNFNDYFEPYETLTEWDELPPTFTVCECLEMLPHIIHDGCTFTASIEKVTSLNPVQHYWAMYNGGEFGSFASNNPADAAGNLLLAVLLSNIKPNVTQCNPIAE